jgi:REP-associated tyrosine transposase
VASLLARRLNRRFKRKGRFFRERFDGKVIKSPKQMRNALKYLLLNSRCHVEPACRPPARDGPVVAPRAWLLTTGWRRYGTLEAMWPG